MGTLSNLFTWEELKQHGYVDANNILDNNYMIVVVYSDIYHCDMYQLYKKIYNGNQTN